MPEVALVTGASSGIGAEFARQLGRRGHDLVLVARRRDRLEELAREIATTVHVVECDLITEADALPGRVAELGVDVDLLVNNAGMGSHGRFVELDPEHERAQVKLNCEAVVALTRAFLPGMVERRRGGVITVASSAGWQPLPYQTVYGATKAFARAFSEALREEVRGSGVKVLAVHPGPVPTEFQHVAGYADPSGSFGVPGRIEADQVVRETLAAYDRGRGSVVPGRLFRNFMRLNMLAPRALKLRTTERMYRPR